jgi:hypothetical protein
MQIEKLSKVAGDFADEALSVALPVSFREMSLDDAGFWSFLGVSGWLSVFGQRSRMSPENGILVIAPSRGYELSEHPMLASRPTGLLSSWSRSGPVEVRPQAYYSLLELDGRRYWYRPYFDRALRSCIAERQLTHPSSQ